MGSVADDLRDEQRREVLRLSPGERLALAFRLGDEDIARLCAVRGITPDVARRLVERARQAGRRPSGAACR